VTRAKVARRLGYVGDNDLRLTAPTTSHAHAWVNLVTGAGQDPYVAADPQDAGEAPREPAPDGWACIRCAQHVPPDATA